MVAPLLIVKLPDMIEKPELPVKSVPGPSEMVNEPLIVKLPSTTSWSIEKLVFIVIPYKTLMVITPSVIPGAEGAPTQAVPLYLSQLVGLVQLPVEEDR